MKKYLALFRIKFTNALQYRAAALAGLTTQFAWGFMLILAFIAFHKANPSAFPMEFSHAVSYIWLQQAFLMLLSSGWFSDSDIYSTIIDGSISYEIVRPINLYNRWFTQITANRVAKTLLRCFPVLIVALLLPAPYKLMLPPNFLQFLLFLVSMVLGLCVAGALCMLVYTLMFFTIASQGVRTICSVITDFLSGAIIPIPFFPQPFNKIAEILPFGSMQNAPLRIYSGDIAGTDALIAIGLQIFWLCAMCLIGRLVMLKALKKVVVQGG